MINALVMKLIGAAVIAVVIGGGWLYIQKLRAERDLEKAKRVVVEEALKTSNATNKRLLSDFEAATKSNAALNGEMSKLRKEVQALDKKFTETKAGEKRELDNLAARHPKLIENAINKGTKEAFRCNELATGAKPDQGEKNSLCPKLLQQ